MKYKDFKKILIEKNIYLYDCHYRIIHLRIKNLSDNKNLFNIILIKEDNIIKKIIKHLINLDYESLNKYVKLY